MAFFIEVGLLLIVVPWSGYWQQNYFVRAWPGLWPYIDDVFVRGAVSGLGALNLFAGFAELAPVFAPPEPRVPVLGDTESDAAYRQPDTRVEP